MNNPKAIFLDRDGVINKLITRNGKAQAPYCIEELSLFEGVLEATLMLKKQGYLLIVVTNQPDVARGWVDKESVFLINSKILETIPLDDIQICFHTNDDKCECRKPKAGMLLRAAEKFNINLQKSFMIGDRYGDIAAGGTANCKTILVGPGDDQKDFPSPDFKVGSLLEAARIICNLNN